MGAGIDRFDFDSTRLAAADRFAAYHALYSAGADVCPAGPDFAATLTAWKLDRALLYDRRLRAVAHVRDAVRVRRDGFEHFTLTCVPAGELHVDSGDGFVRMPPGAVLIADTARPAINRAVDARIVTMSVARERVALLTDRPERLHGVLIPAERAFLLADHMRALVRHGGLLGAAQLQAVSRVTIDLLAAALAGSGVRAPMAYDRARLDRTDRVRAFIDERLADGIAVDTLLERFALSRATLYRDFAVWGGVGRYVAERRLERLRARLADPGDTRSMAALADALGFSTESRMSASFLGRFGTRPGRYRRMLADEAEPQRARRSMREWQATLRTGSNRSG